MSDRNEREQNEPDDQAQAAADPEPDDQAQAPAHPEPDDQAPPSPQRGEETSADVSLSHPAVVRILAALIICASAMMVMWNLQTRSKKNSNTGSRYATVEALVDHGTYVIDDSVYSFTIDKVKIGDHFYSSKPPTLSTYAAGSYWLYQKLTGKRIATDEGAVLWFVGLSTGWLTHVVLLVYFFLLGRLLLRRQLAQLGSLIAVAFGCLSVALATTLNNHSFAACLILGCYYHAVCARRDATDRFWHWPAAGLYAGFVPAIDLPSGLVPTGVFALLLLRHWRRALLWFLPAVVPGVAVHFMLTYAVTGGLSPVYLRTELYKYEGSYWLRRGGIDNLREPKHIYAFHVLLGHHGLFSMTPLFGFSLVGLVRSVTSRLTRPLTASLKQRLLKDTSFQESVFILLLVVATVVFYIVRTRNYGGWSVGMRWLVPIMPLLMFYFGVWLDQTRLFERLWDRAKWALVVASFGVGVFHVQDGMTSPFQFSRWHNWLDGTPNRNRQAAKLNLGKAERDQARQEAQRAQAARRKATQKKAAQKKAAQKKAAQKKAAQEKAAQE